MSVSPVNLRNLERIVEGSRAKSPRLATFLLAASGAAAVLVVGMAMRQTSACRIRAEGSACRACSVSCQTRKGGSRALRRAAVAQV